MAGKRAGRCGFVSLKGGRAGMPGLRLWALRLLATAAYRLGRSLAFLGGRGWDGETVLNLNIRLLLPTFTRRPRPAVLR